MSVFCDGYTFISMYSYYNQLVKFIYSLHTSFIAALDPIDSLILIVQLINPMFAEHVRNVLKFLSMNILNVLFKQ